MLEVTKKQAVKTRKKHECHGCCEIIDKGVAAIHVRGKEDGRHVHFHLHVQCHIMAMKQKLFNVGFPKGAINRIRENNNDYSAEDVSVPF